MREVANGLLGLEAARHVRLMVVLAVVAFLAAASGAAAKPALSPGVQVDPGSPASKQYAIPLAQARAGGTSGGSGSGTLFGSGITRAAPASSTPAAPRPRTPASRARRAGGPTGGDKGSGAVAQSGQVTAAPGARVPAPGRLAGGGAGIAWMLGVAALVLALGGLGGAALARHSRGSSTLTS